MADDKIKKIKIFLENPDYAIFKGLSETSDKLGELDKKLNDVDFDKLGYMKGDKGEKGDTIVGEKGDRGERGERGEKGDKGIDGKNGNDGLNGKNGKDGLNGKDGSPDTPQQIINKINTLRDSLEIRVIRGLSDTIIKTIWQELKNPKAKNRLEPKDIKGMPLNFNDMRWHGGGMSQDKLVYNEIPAGNIDGVNKTFTLTYDPVLGSVRVNNPPAIWTDQGTTPDYTILGKVITTTYPPISIILVNYTKQ